MTATRRCQQAQCDRRFEIDLYDPKDQRRRYCSPECEERDISQMIEERIEDVVERWRKAHPEAANERSGGIKPLVLLRKKYYVT